MQRLAASIGKEYNYEVPDHLDDGWDCADLADVGIDKEKISQFINRITVEKHDEFHSILIVKDSKLILEEYLPQKENVSAHLSGRFFGIRG